MSGLIWIETKMEYWFNYSSSSKFSSAAQTFNIWTTFLLLRTFFHNAGNILRWWYLSRMPPIVLRPSAVATSPVMLRWLCDSPQTGCALRTKDIYVARTRNNRVISSGDLYCCLLPRCEALRTCRSGFPIATKWCCDQDVEVVRSSAFTQRTCDRCGSL